MNRRKFFFIGTGAAAAAVAPKPAEAQAQEVRIQKQDGSTAIAQNVCGARMWALFPNVTVAAHESAALLFQSPNGELHMCRHCAGAFVVATTVRDRR